MKLSIKTQLVVRETELIMLGKAFKLFAVAFAKAAPDDVEPALRAVSESIVDDMTDLVQKFPEGITADHPLPLFARSMQKLFAEARDDIAKAAKPQ